MNKFKSYILLVTLLIAIPSFGKGIELDGQWDKYGKSIIPNIPIIANIQETDKSITLEFLKNLGNIDIIISDKEGNIVYQENVQTEEIPQVCISLEGLPIEEGIISITNGENLVYGFINF